MSLPVEKYWKPIGVWDTKEALEWLILLESDSKEAPRAREIELSKCKVDRWHWITHWVKTEDPQNKEFPFQPFPNKIHLQVLTHAWEVERNLLVPKTRQMTATWQFVALYLHDSMFYPSRNTIFQCKIEDDSDANLKRAVTIHEHLPAWMREWQPMHYTYCHAEFPRSRSQILAVAAGAKHFRQRTLTGVMVDEAAYTEGLDQVVEASKPALGRNGRLTALSSATPSTFGNLVFDREGI